LSSFCLEYISFLLLFGNFFPRICSSVKSLISPNVDLCYLFCFTCVLINTLLLSTCLVWWIHRLWLHTGQEKYLLSLFLRCLSQCMELTSPK
jgi:hypothetical protein